MVVGSHELDVRPVEQIPSLSPIVWDIPDAGKPATLGLLSGFLRYLLLFGTYRMLESQPRLYPNWVVLVENQ